MLSTRHLNIIKPNFYKKSESRSPESESSALTKHIGMDDSQNDSLGCSTDGGLEQPQNYPKLHHGVSKVPSYTREGTKCSTHIAASALHLWRRSHTFLQKKVKRLKEFSLTKMHFLKITYQNDFGITVLCYFILQMLFSDILIISAFCQCYEYGQFECRVTFLEVLHRLNKFCKYLERELM